MGSKNLKAVLFSGDRLQEMIRAATGLNANSDALKEKAAEISSLVRNFNIREGLRPEDDRLPKRLHQKLEDTDKTITQGELETMLRDYYRLRGRDDQGYPPRWKSTVITSIPFESLWWVARDLNAPDAHKPAPGLP